MFLVLLVVYMAAVGYLGYQLAVYDDALNKR